MSAGIAVIVIEKPKSVFTGVPVLTIRRMY